MARNVGASSVLSPSDFFDRITNTFTADRAFFDALLRSDAATGFVELWLWGDWIRDNTQHLQAAFEPSVPPEYQAHFVGLTVGAATSLMAVPWAAARGAVYEAGGSSRRALEYIGVLAHVLREPAKRPVFTGGDKKGFKEAFTNIQPRPLDTGIDSRFLALEPEAGRFLSRAYSLLSAYQVHGESMASLVHVELAQTPYGCAYLNRSLDRVSQMIPVLCTVMGAATLALLSLANASPVTPEPLREAARYHTEPSYWLTLKNEANRQFGVS